MTCIKDAAPPAAAGSALSALWHEHNGAWDVAHNLVQGNTPENCWVHAYLHRQEGDATNAAYWYRQANKPAATGPAEAEWQAIVNALTAGAPP